MRVYTFLLMALLAGAIGLFVLFVAGVTTAREKAPRFSSPTTRGFRWENLSRPRGPETPAAAVQVADSASPPAEPPPAGEQAPIAADAAAAVVRWADAATVAESQAVSLASLEARLRQPEASTTALRDALQQTAAGDAGSTARIALYDAWLSGKPDDHARRFDLAAELMRRSLFAEALPHLRQITAAQPANVRAWHNLAIAAQGCGLLQESESAWSRRIALDDSAAEAFVYRGEVRLDLRLDQPAADDFQQALQRGPRTPDLLLNLALARERLGDLSGAYAAADEASAAAPQAALAVNRAADLAWKLYENALDPGAKSAAIRHWQRSLEIDPGQPQVRGRLWEAQSAN